MNGMQALSVAQLNMYVRALLDSDVNLRSILVRGEVSNYTRNARSGHVYFTLKDSGAAIKAVMFCSNADKLDFRPEDGMRVLVFGRVTLYERDGAYQLYVERMVHEGLGAAYLEFLRLKDKLQGEGLFAAEHKKPIPKYPERIGVITSSTGAALQDILSVCSRRYPAAEIIVCPCSVQGDDCPSSVMRALERLDDGTMDVIIIARGGGAYEDLSGFNDEALAKAVYAASTPIISAVGHETDFTVLDFVADARAPTPSAAAELATPSIAELVSWLDALCFRCIGALQRRLNESYSRVDSAAVRISPVRTLAEKTAKLDYMCDKILTCIVNRLQRERMTVDKLSASVNACRPMAALMHGYGLVRAQDGRNVSSVDMVSRGDRLSVRLKDGEIYCVAERTEKL